mmetsp:Transcript_17242/g.31463  ORF Transcript_17242/g.31463 Transcript_17242/m.31463 type:complete len:89 (-) Transcript_17242:754-1020(-)
MSLPSGSHWCEYFTVPSCITMTREESVTTAKVFATSQQQAVGWPNAGGGKTVAMDRTAPSSRSTCKAVMTNGPAAASNSSSEGLKTML